MPAACPKNTPKNGTIIQTDTCWAVLGSLTRDEMAIMTAMEMRPIKGDQIRNRISQPGLTIAKKTRWLVVNNAMPTIKISPLNQVTPTPGISAARLLPTSSSHVRVGVANSGSSVRLVFSPTTLYDAIMLVIIDGSSKKSTESCMPTNACATSEGDK